MERDEKNNFCEFLLKEYWKLKDEQRVRIDFRDKMIFVTLGAIGAVFSFAIEKPEYSIALLVLPFVCIVMGWTYLANDEKISSIGKYLREVLIPKYETIISSGEINLKENWEEFHRKDKRRSERKGVQLIIDLSLFCLSSFFSIIVYFFMIRSYSSAQIAVALSEALFTIFLGYQFFKYSAINEE